MDKLKQLFENANLPTDFAQKASVLFEASMNEAVEARVRQEVQKIQEAAEANLEKEKEAWIKESEEDVEKFLEAQVTEWAKANSAALVGSTKTALAESLLAKMKALFESEGIEMPEVKEKAIKESEEEIEKLKEELEDKEEELKEAKAQIVAFTKSKIIAEATKGLSRVAAGRIASLSENITFKNTRQFAGAVASITEGVSGKRLKLKEDAPNAADLSGGGQGVSDKFPDNGNADKNKATADPLKEDAPNAADLSGGGQGVADKFPATSNNSDSAGSEKDKATAKLSESEGEYFQDDEDDKSKSKVDESKGKSIKEDAGVDNKEVNPDGSGDASQDPAKVNENFDVVALTRKSLKLNG